MWFPQFRNPPDYDLYADQSFVDHFTLVHKNNIKSQTRTERKAVITLVDGIIVDITTTAKESWTKAITKANDQSKPISFLGTNVTLASPTTLRLIKEVLSCWRLNWRKHAGDYLFLKTLVTEPYLPQELNAMRIGMANFGLEYGVSGLQHLPANRSYSLDELERIVQRVNLKSRVYIKDNISNLLGLEDVEII